MSVPLCQCCDEQPRYQRSRTPLTIGTTPRPAPFPTIARLPGRALVTVTLGDGSQRSGQVLVDYDDDVMVEYQTPAGHFTARRFTRSAVTWL